MLCTIHESDLRMLLVISKGDVSSNEKLMEINPIFFEDLNEIFYICEVCKKLGLERLIKSLYWYCMSSYVFMKSLNLTLSQHAEGWSAQYCIFLFDMLWNNQQSTISQLSSAYWMGREQFSFGCAIYPTIWYIMDSISKRFFKTSRRNSSNSETLCIRPSLVWVFYDR